MLDFKVRNCLSVKTLRATVIILQLSSTTTVILFVEEIDESEENGLARKNKFSFESKLKFKSVNKKSSQEKSSQKSFSVTHLVIVDL